MFSKHIENIRSIVDALEKDPLSLRHNVQFCRVGAQEFFNLEQFLFDWERARKSV